MSRSKEGGERISIEEARAVVQALQALPIKEKTQEAVQVLQALPIKEKTQEAVQVLQALPIKEECIAVKESI